MPGRHPLGCRASDSPASCPASPAPELAGGGVRGGQGGVVGKEHLPVFGLLASAIALCSVISSTVSVHLLTILQTGGLSLAAAVALGAMVGPAQVGARVVEMVFGTYYHPIWT